MEREETVRERITRGKKVYWSRRPVVSNFCINTDVLYEDAFPVAQFASVKRSAPSNKQLLGEYYSYNKIRSMYAEGRVSVVHGHVVKLEVAFDSSNRLVTSARAFRRFIERMNGTIPLFGETELPVPVEKTSL